MFPCNIREVGQTNIKETEETKRNYRGFVFHLHPPKVLQDSIRFNRTFGLGGMALLLFLIQGLTGILLRFAYVPSPEKAYDSILFIDHDILFGGFVRNIHHWSGIFFVIITFLHFIRVFYSQAIFVPRRVNWIIGWLTPFCHFFKFHRLSLTLGSTFFLGCNCCNKHVNLYSIYWRWIAKNYPWRNDVGSATLLNFYNFHTGILPIGMVLLMIWHFWKVRKAKGVAIPDESSDLRVPSNPNLVQRIGSRAYINCCYFFFQCCFECSFTRSGKSGL